MILHSLDWQIILSAFVLDLLLGDPRIIPHPVVLIGKMITFVEDSVRIFAMGKEAELWYGAKLAVVVPVIAFVVTLGVIHLAHSVNYMAGWIAAVYLGYTTIAARSLYSESWKVAKLLSTGNIQEAREALSSLVGRDTHNLDERGITRALVETVAENASDGVIAPLFYLAVGGPPLAMAYKAVNTLDSMVGYKNERYLYFGRASARLDDIANYIPARITAILLVFAAFILRKDWRDAWRIMLRDGRNHPSPNSGYPEAAVAGALGRRLGGLSYYGGTPSNKPFIGDDAGDFQIGDIRKAGRLMITSAALMVLMSFFILSIWGHGCI